jgi:hypothetical protein
MVNQDIWIKLAMRRASEHEREGRHVVITDVRFKNEAEAIRHAGGQVWLVERPGAGLEGAAGGHSSEAGIPGHLVNQVVRNIGTLDDLEEAVNAAFHSLPCVTMGVSTQ